MEVEAHSLDHIHSRSVASPLSAGKAALTIEEYVPLLIDKCDLRVSHIRSSGSLRDIFNTVVLSIAERGYIHSWGLYCMKARLDALLKLAVDQLTIPTYMTALGVGSGSFSLFSGSSPVDPPQEVNLTLEEKIRVLLKDVFLLFVRSENERLRTGSDKNLDLLRGQLFLGMIRLKCSPLYPQSLVLKEYGPRALEALTCHILGVIAVSSTIRVEIQNATRQLINALHVEDAGGLHQSSPELQAILQGFFEWLRSSTVRFIKDCRREEIVSAVNPVVRARLKDETYHSPAHLVKTFHHTYKTLLQNMPIPIQPYSIHDIKQAHKDILRENIRVNKIVYVGGKTLTPTGSLQSGRDLQLDAPYINKFDALAIASAQDAWEEVDATEAIADELKKVVVFLCGLPDGSLLQTSPSMLHRKSLPPVPPASTVRMLQKKQSWEQELEMYESPRSGRKQLRVPSQLPGPLPAPPTPTTSEVGVHTPAIDARVAGSGLALPAPVASASIYRDLHRILLAYTLIAASRTYAAGDAFMILNDLYGGDGLMFCPFLKSTSPSGPSTPQRSRSASIMSQGSETSSVSGSSGEQVACQVAITTSGVKVKLKEHYRLYATAEMNSCSDSNQLPQPLACFECTTTSIIILSPTTISAAEKAAGDGIQLDQLSFSQLFEVLISNPQKIVHRAVTIEPYN